MSAVIKAPAKTMTGSVLDRAAICVSAACLVQCLLLSLTLLIAPVLSLGVFGSDAFHRVLLAVILPLSVAAFALGYRAHRSAGLLLPGAVGLGLLFLAAFLEARVLGPLTASALTSLGGLCLMAAHWLNLRQRRRARMRPGH